MTITKRTPWNKGKKESVKHIYYTDGNINIRIPFDKDPPDGFVRGRKPRNYSGESKRKFVEKCKATKFDRYGDENYNNATKNKQTKLLNHGDENYNNREKASQTCLYKYGVDNVSKCTQVSSVISNKLIGHKCSDETRMKISNARKGTHLSEEMRVQKTINTNNTYHEKGLYKRHKTKPELFVEDYLNNTFGSNHVFYNYVDKERYPYKCDFYVDSYDLFIEVHAGWRHGVKPYEVADMQCESQLADMIAKSKTSDNYKNAIYTWAELDVKKLECAKKHNLNYVRLYNDDIYFINEKPRELLGTLVKLYHGQDNQQPRLPIWK